MQLRVHGRQRAIDADRLLGAVGRTGEGRGLKLPNGGAGVVRLELSRCRAFLSDSCLLGQIDTAQNGMEGVGLVRGLLAHGIEELFCAKWTIPLDRITVRTREQGASACWCRSPSRWRGWRWPLPTVSGRRRRWPGPERAGSDAVGSVVARASAGGAAAGVCVGVRDALRRSGLDGIAPCMGRVRRRAGAWSVNTRGRGGGASLVIGEPGASKAHLEVEDLVVGSVAVDLDPPDGIGAGGAEGCASVHTSACGRLSARQRPLRLIRVRLTRHLRKRRWRAPRRPRRPLCRGPWAGPRRGRSHERRSSR